MKEVELLRAAEALKNAGQLQQAATLTEQTIRQFNHSPRGYTQLASILQQAGDDKRAMAACQHALKQDTRHIPARLLMADIFQGMGHAARAHEQLALCYQHAADNPDIQLRYANSLLYNRGYPEAQEILEKKLLPNSAYADMAQINLGILNNELERPQQALEHFKQLSSAMHKSSGVQMMIAECQAKSGNVSAARSLYVQQLTEKPDTIDAWCGLAEYSPQTIDDDDLAKLEQRAENAKGIDKIRLLYSLAWVAQARQQWDEELQWLRQANTLDRQREHYDAQANENYCQQLLATYGQDFYQQAVEAGDKEWQPIFIMGMPRSGTTTTERLLSLHPDIASTGESPALPRAFDALEARQKTILQKGQQPEPQALVAAFLDEYRFYIRDFLQLATPWFVDTAKMNFQYMGVLAAAFPQAQFIHVTRDPRDMALNCYRKWFRYGAPYSNDLADCIHARAVMDKTIDQWQQQLPVQVHQMSYEDMVRNTQTLAELLKKLGLSIDSLPADPLDLLGLSAAWTGDWKHYPPEGLTCLFQAMEASGF